MKKLATFTTLLLILGEVSNAEVKYLVLSKMSGFDFGFFGFTAEKVTVDFEKIEGQYYPLYNNNKQIFIGEDRVKNYYKTNDKNFVCKIPVKPDGSAYVTRLIHRGWSFFKDKGYYSVLENGKYKKVNIDELVFNCLKFENGNIVEPK
jgi:hypothetical protein